jgi:hypothetical protein
MGRGARALVLGADGRPFVNGTRPERAWLTPAVGAFAVGTAIAVPLVGPAGLLALLLPLGMVGYSALLARSTERTLLELGGLPQKNAELLLTHRQLRGRVTELHAAVLDSARQRAHENERSYQSVIRAFIEAMHPADAGR